MKRDPSFFIAGGVVIVLVGLGAGINLWPHYFGATIDDIANVNLAQSPKKLAKALPASHESGNHVKVHFRHTVPEFEVVELGWDDSQDHVTSMRLELEHEKKETGKTEHGDVSWHDRLEARLLGFGSSNDREWGFVRFSFDGHALSFRVKRAKDKMTNDMFDQQVEAARQVLVAVAFGREPSLPPKEIADALGTGYAAQDVALVDVTLGTSSIAPIVAKFPGSLHTKDTVTIPLVHPFVHDVKINWSGARVHVDFHMMHAYGQAHETFGPCIAKQPAGALLEVREQDLDTVSYMIDPRSFGSLIQALDACRQ